jgi:hypothetical protein
MPRPITDEPGTTEPEATDLPEATEDVVASSEPDGADEPLGQEDAAAAEAEAFENMELTASEAAGAADQPGNQRLVVAGLTTVAGISAFKGALGQLEGVQGVSVMAGERGTFVFTVAHDAGVDLPAALPRLPGFDAQMTERDDDTIHVSAREPAA